uniref:FYR C-terminal domain-containing protein n=1 Tax=Tetradesmus obliquus TaxID=3088 RepID=A0A383VQI9_TETOB|eukprot:jgi/Sobl393_1/11576/SZX66994.1
MEAASNASRPVAASASAGCAGTAEAPAAAAAAPAPAPAVLPAAEPSTEPSNAFEAERARIMAKNRRVMQEMGVMQAAASLKALKQPKPKYAGLKRPKPKEEVAEGPARTSRRARGMHAEDAAGSDATDADAAAAAKPAAPRFELTATQYAAPFTITSIGVTVLELGQVYRGPWQQQYWSSRGALFRHAYPVGYAASKEVFGRTWRMSISAGEAGPVFTVVDEAAGVSYSGSSPTQPWTAACLQRCKTQRISGPLLFGFSDVHVQRAIAAQYMPAELAYAQYGTLLPADVTHHTHLAAAEAAAAAGAGAATAGAAGAAEAALQAGVSEAAPVAAAAGRAASVCEAPSTAAGGMELACALPSTVYVAPFTLAASRVTVLSLGHVGYAASKEVFGRTWRMSISPGEAGPLFTVADEAAGVSYSGSSPTQPWTAACLQHRKTQRISGPAFFGFTDSVVRLAIAEQYTPAELAYVEHGVMLPAVVQQGTGQNVQQVQHFDKQQQQEQRAPQQAVLLLQEKQPDKQQQQQQAQVTLEQQLRPALQQLSPAELCAREQGCCL